MQRSESVASTIYEVLAVGPPDDRIGNAVSHLTFGVVLLNTAALIVDAVGVSSSVVLWVVGVVETISTAFFATDYGLRLWTAPADPTFRGRLRFALRPLSIIDLAAVVPMFVALFAPAPEGILRVLRAGWLVRHLKLVRHLRARPLHRDTDALVAGATERLARVRERLAEVRERDFGRVQQRVRAAVRRGVEIARPQRVGSAPMAATAVAARMPALLALLDELEADLTESSQLRAPAEIVAGAYRESAAAFDDAPETAAVEIALENGRVGQKSVPLRSLGQHHFAALAVRADQVVDRKDLLYLPDVRRELARVRKALNEGMQPEDPTEADIALRAIDLLRDMDAPVRLAWDTLLFQFEEEHRSRLQLLRTDIARYGHPSYRAGRAWRWIVRRLNATLRARELTVRSWSTLVRLYREGVGSMTRAVRLTLLRLGILKPPIHEMLLALDEARLDSVLERGLPADYLRHFELSTPRDDGLWVGFDDELVRIRSAHERWNRRQIASFVVYGHRGVGKTTLLLQARNQILNDGSLTHVTFDRKLVTMDTLVAHLGEALGAPAAIGADGLAEALLAGPRRAVFLDDVHHLFFRTIGGLDAVRSLFWLIAKTDHHVFWGISLDTNGYEFLAHAMPLAELFHLHVSLDERTSDDLRRLIMTRHNRSGVSLHYVRDKRNEKAFRRRMKALRQRNRSAQAHPQEALELIFFDQLAAASKGNVVVAAFYWLRSLRVADEDRYRVEPFEPLDLSLLWESSEDQAFILAALLQHGTLTATELGRVLDVDPIGVRLDLEILSNLNVLQSQVATDTFRMNPVVQKTVCDVLRARNLLQ
jgi:hypothetical protein